MKVVSQVNGVTQMTAILACRRCHSDIRDAGTTMCAECERNEEATAHVPAAEHCLRCGLGWRPLDAHDHCPTCAEFG